MKTYDYFIIGQGIAGSLVAYQLLKQHKSILVIDNFNPNSSSNIAAGVVNPVTGRKLVKSWMIDELLPYAKSIYKELEELLGISFFYETELYKFMISEEDIQLWNKRKSDPEYQDYLGDIIPLNHDSLNTPYGVGVIKNSCWMDVPKFIRAFRNYLISKEILLNQEFEIDESALVDSIYFDDNQANRIIFCEGYRAVHNPLFKQVNFSTAKGEHLLIYTDELACNQILSKNIYIIPKGDNHYNVGSTFIWDDLSEDVTESGRKELLDKLDRMLNCNYEIIEEKAAIRPTMIDRRPVIGQLQKYKNVYIFNGLGTKGVSLAPYFSNYFVSGLEGGRYDISEISINRFDC